ncbi:hypothetical protein ACN4EK_14240 [Pantanalinema rosaneae CENA516]|uniref:hypothetical protein n=1 Tax=Pantanalinema rosaneae TaxID=1620701 RepID=UPI003D6E59CF
MFKQFSIAAIQQELTKLETLRYEQLKGLLEKLECQKKRLPIEDHPIIDWGISLIKVKMKEEEKLKNRMSESSAYFASKYRDYSSFMLSSRWDNLNLSIQKDLNFLYDSGLNCLDEILTKSCTEDERFLVYTTHFKAYLFRFCNEQRGGLVFQKIIGGYISHYSDAYYQQEQKVSQLASQLAQYLTQN